MDYLEDGIHQTISNAMGGSSKGAINPRVQPSGFYNLSPEVQSNLYEHVWIFGKIIDLTVEDMTTKGWYVKHHGDASPEAISELERRLNLPKVKTKFSQALKDARIFGGSAIIADLQDGKQPIEPVDLERLVEVGRMRSLDRTWVHPAPETIDYDLLDPEWYYVTPTGYGSDVTHRNTERHSQRTASDYTAHRSRILRFDGLHLPHYKRIQRLGWGGSLIDRIYDPWQRLNQFETLTLTAVERLSVFIHSIKGLTDFAKKGQLDKLQKHLNMLHQQLNVANTLVMDDDRENGKFESRSISGLDKLYAELKETVTAATGMSWSLFWGRVGTGGLSNGGNTELSNHAKHCASLQEMELKENLETYAQWIIYSDDFEFTSDFEKGVVEVLFHPLYPLTEEQEAEVSSKKADMITKYLDRNLSLEQIQLIMDGQDLNAVQDAAPEIDPAEMKAFQAAKQQQQMNALTTDPAQEDVKEKAAGAKTEKDKVSDATEPSDHWFKSQAAVTNQDVTEAIEKGSEILPEQFEEILKSDARI